MNLLFGTHAGLYDIDDGVDTCLHSMTERGLHSVGGHSAATVIRFGRCLLHYKKNLHCWHDWAGTCTAVVCGAHIPGGFCLSIVFQSLIYSDSRVSKLIGSA